MDLKIIPSKYFENYEKNLAVDIVFSFGQLKEQEITPDSFKFYTSVAVISSSKIEGEVLEVDSYLKHKLLNTAYLPELLEKPNDLYQAYLFAKNNPLNKNNFLEAHKLTATHLLPKQARGVCRKNVMIVLEHKTNRIQYEAAQAQDVEKVFQLLFEDIDVLMKAVLTENEIFYYASMIHLVFVNIHPFEDGNGRTGRLLEKWFLAQKLGEKAWFVPSESYCYRHIDKYYKNLARMGVFYQQLDYTKSDRFLQMLPNSLSETLKRYHE